MVFLAWERTGAPWCSHRSGLHDFPVFVEYAEKTHVLPSWYMLKYIVSEKAGESNPPHGFFSQNLPRVFKQRTTAERPAGVYAMQQAHGRPHRAAPTS